MTKKKDKPQVINNIGELNLEIDYDKLAEAIVKAREKTENADNETNKCTTEFFSLCITVILRLFVIFSWVFLALIILQKVIRFKYLEWNSTSLVVTNVCEIVLWIMLIIITVFFSVMIWKSSREFMEQNDRSYVISVFSGIVSFAALIVSLVALFKGVG